MPYLPSDPTVGSPSGQPSPVGPLPNSLKEPIHMPSRTIHRTRAQWAILNANSLLERLAAKGRIQRPPVRQHITVVHPDGSRFEVARTVNVDRPDVAPEVTIVEVPVVAVAAPQAGPEGGTADAPGAAPEAPPVAPQPTVRHTLSDGKPLVIVSLCGRLGRGQHICLDPVEWEGISAAHGSRWLLQTDGKACGYVRGGKRGRLHLARLVMNALPGQQVEFVHRRKVGALMVGLDMRRANLRLGPALPQRKPRSAV